MPNITVTDTRWGDACSVIGRPTRRADGVCRCRDAGRSGYTNCVTFPL